MRPALLALALLAPAPAVAEPTAVTFLCERGVQVPVVFADGLAVAWIEDGLRVMPQAISASGARYREAGEGYQLSAKGETATIFYGPDGAEVVLLSECQARFPAR